MAKRITIDELRPGMRIEKLDRSWLTTPFLRHRMAVTSADQIAQLRACGVRMLHVAEEEGEEDPSSGPSLEAAAAKPPSDCAPDPLADVPFGEELPVARQVYQAAKSVIQGAMLDARMGRAINMEAVNRVVADMADSILRNADALTSLSRLKRFDEYTFFHSVNTAVLALSLGRAVGMTHEALHQLGVGTLLHDIGKTRIPLEILNKPGRFDAQEYELMKQHVMRGAEVLSEMTDLSDPYLKPTLEHHERVDGSGYPFKLGKSALSQSGMIAAVVDVYDAITSDRCYHKAKPAHDALSFLFVISQRGHLDHGLVQHFIQLVGVYPVGSLVELNTGEVAVVRQVHHDAPLEPSVIVVKGPGRTLLSHPQDVELRHQTGTPRRFIVAAADATETALQPALYLDKESL